MANSKVQFICSVCGEEYPKWSGKCSNCGNWNTLREQEISKLRSDKIGFDRITLGLKESLPQLVRDVPVSKLQKIVTGNRELDRVLSGGLVPGSLTLISGEPGIGKSTLVLQLAAQISQKQNVLYVSGEESLSQIKMRAERLQVKPLKLHLFAETNLEKILAQIKKIKPSLIIMDSIQTIYSDAFTGISGSITQVSNCTNVLLEVAKLTNIPVVLVGHVTKTGNVAGPMILEHIVDAILFLEGERYHDMRILRVIKNRFGSTLEVGIFKMGASGLIEVKNPSGLFIEERAANNPGSVVFVNLEGNRPFLVEIQALVNRTILTYPRRTASGVSLNRLQVLIAVLEKCCGLKLGNADIYVNVVGGFKLKEPAADLAICLAIASSLLGKVIPAGTVAIGEVGLLGDLRSVSQLMKRVEEAKRLGFKRCLVSGKHLPKISGIQIQNFADLNAVLKIINS